jgi:membrane protease YdiL (CAAX protease family)
MRTIPGISQIRWFSAGGLELTVVVVFIQLIAHAALAARFLGPHVMAAVYAGFALLIYGGAICAGEDSARRALAWIGGPWRRWAAAAVAGSLLGMVVTSATLSFGHPIHIDEAAHNEVVAITLGPIVEEICLRGILMPLIARIIGPRGAAIFTGALFAILHWPASALKLASIGLTGVAYGSIRARSGSTAFAATAHATYNMTVLLFGLWT